MKGLKHHQGGVVSAKMSDGDLSCWLILTVSNDAALQPCERVRTARSLTEGDGKDGCNEVFVIQLTGVCASGGADVSPLLTVGSAVPPPPLLQAALVDPSQAASRDTTVKRNVATQSAAALEAALTNVQAAQDRAAMAHATAEAAARAQSPAAQVKDLRGQAESFKDQLVRSAVQLKKCAAHAKAAAALLEHSADTLEVASQGPTLTALEKQRLADAAKGAKLQATQLAASATVASAHALLLLPEDGASSQNPIEV